MANRLGHLNHENKWRGCIIAKIISKNDNDKSFLLHTKNAGSMAKSTGFFDDAKGGNLLVYAKINDSKTEPLLDGKIILENIRLSTFACKNFIFSFFNWYNRNFLRRRNTLLKVIFHLIISPEYYFLMMQESMAHRLE